MSCLVSFLKFLENKNFNVVYACTECQSISFNVVGLTYFSELNNSKNFRKTAY